MAYQERWRSVIALCLVLAMLLMPAARVSAEELAEIPEQVIPEETVIPEDTAALEETVMPEETEVPEETVIPEETEVPVETVMPEETESAEVPEVVAESPEQENTEQEDSGSQPESVPIADVLQMAAGETPLVMEGTVVYADRFQAVLQDETGGIRLSSVSSEQVKPGEILRVTGHRSGGFAVEGFEILGTGELPAVKSTLQSDCSALRIWVKGAVVGYNSLSQKGYTCQMEGRLPEGMKPGDLVDAWGVILDGIFYADTLTMSESREPETVPDSDWNFYFGLLHAHTSISDGTGTVEEAFAHAKAVEGLDFFAVTDHSNSFDNADRGSVDVDGSAISREWESGKQAAADATDETFVGIFGYEMTWPEDLAIGHINTFATPGWQTREQEGMQTLKGYLDALAAVPDSVSQFNHPGLAYGDFACFSDYSPDRDARVHLLEVGSEGSFTAYDAYATALDAGWHLAPSTSENNHHGSWGDESPDRTVVLARELTEESVYDALRKYRVYATEDPDLKIEYHVNGRIMGSIMPVAETLTAEITLEDGSGDPIGRVEIVTEGAEVAASAMMEASAGKCTLELPTGGSYYYVRILRNEKIIAVTAPVWVDTYEDLGIADFASDALKPEPGTQVNLTLTLFNWENLPFLVDRVEYTLGEEVIETVFTPGNVEPLGKLEIPLTYDRETAGAVTVTATVTGTVSGLSRTYRKDITLHYQLPEAELLSVEAVRSGLLGDGYRIRGYVTAGTANRHNTFPGSIYLQDETGGIQIMDFTRKGIQLGTPMEIEGILRSSGGNLVLAMTDYEILQEDYYRHVPRTMTHRMAMNYENHGGQLLQIEGHVISVTKTPDQKGVSRFTVRDIVGDLATVMVEEDIGSGAYGTNELISEVQNTKTVRAMGLLHIDEYGKTVLRVRNCDEVVYVPPINDPSNPKTGDWLARFLHWF